MTSSLPRIRLVAFNDVYELANLCRVQTFLTQLGPTNAVLMAGDFLSPSTLSALDGGKGMVHCLRAVGVTHVSLGNHEADLRLNKLQRRLEQLNKSGVKVLNSNIVGTSHQTTWLNASLAPYDIIHSACQRVRVGLMGLISDEPHMFRDGTFRGATIGNVTNTMDEIRNSVLPTQVDMWIPLTHQWMKRDQEVAEHMLRNNYGSGLIVGGHDHVYMDEKVSWGNESIRILKSGYNANAMHLIDLTFDTVDDKMQLVDLQAQLVEMKEFEPSAVIAKIVDSHMALLTALENEEIMHAEAFLPPGVTLSSVGSRCRQTTVGAILCKSIKDELEVDVAMINGATIKGNMEYPDSSMSYAQLKAELPFPTKMVIVPMKRWQLHDAIYYSRTQPASDDPKFERKGYLQVDMEFDRLGFHTGSQDDDLMVALPRNLLNGFTNIEPLMHVGAQMKKEGTFPGDDDFIPAINVVVRHFCKERWYEMVQDKMTFEELDAEHKGFLSRDDVKRMMAKAIGHEPADFVIDDMIAALDADENGVIDPGEFSHLLAEMEREHGGLIRFD